MRLYIDTRDRENTNISIIKDDILIAEKKLSDIKARPESALDLVIKALKDTKSKVSDIKEIEVEKGPGSYTGVRVGIAIANALSFALNIPLNRKKYLNWKYHTISMFKFLHHLFIPHKGNNHRAKLIHNSSLLVLFLLLLFTSWVSVIVNNTHPEVLGISYSMTDQELLLLVNQKRIENGQDPLRLNDRLNQAAAEKAQYMFENNFWAHFAPDGTTPWKFITENGYDYIYAGENLAKGFTNTDDVVEAWMSSPAHRENLLSEQYQDVGFAIIEGNLQGEDTVLIVQMFGQEKSSFLANANTDIGVSGESKRTEVASVNETVEVPLIADESSSQESLGISLYESKPILDMLFSAKSISFILISFLLIALILDFIVVSRKRIPRMVGNNLDHILILSIFLVFVFIYNIGSVL